jgi:hypothetical protein
MLPTTCFLYDILLLSKDYERASDADVLFFYF